MVDPDFRKGSAAQRITARTTPLDYYISSCSVHAAHMEDSKGARHDVVRADVRRHAQGRI